ncbi:probable glutathione peroxidase 8 isoform X1 [Brienomyrus brachyistius]|uniref:probable glutathione peroxidase 8 isoform X1 n=1 Tax=Brienomyrus brachyistius TaxID=42636 RepID=UPI0020B425D9|nr:probable glutathione peroxidase 8 isoform X1 [Brienomyrus brachyistius]
MEPLLGYPVKPSGPKTRKLIFFLSTAICVGTLFLLQTKFFKPRKPKDFYSFDVRDARGRTVSLEKYRGKASLVVNVASHCEHTESNYRALQELHRELGTSHFNVLAFPCGQFGDTEPGSSRDIEAFAKSNFAVTFPIFSKIKIMGSEADAAFKYITDTVQKLPKWNFWKFLVNPEGKVVRFWRPEEPMEEIRKEASALVREIILKKRVEL